MKSQAEVFAAKQNFIKSHLECMNYLGAIGLELDCIDERWQFLTFRRIERRVQYHLLAGGGLAVSYRPMKGKAV